MKTLEQKAADLYAGELRLVRFVPWDELTPVEQSFYLKAAMLLPKRIQMSRQRPWRAENPDAVIVDRRTKWGNPFKSKDYATDYPLSADWTPEAWQRMCTSDFRMLARGRKDEAHEYPSMKEIIAELGGRDLACWCPPDKPCHADVLLELANPKEES